jgi:hypothetical protein
MLPKNNSKIFQPPAPQTKINNVKFINPQTIACEETKEQDCCRRCNLQRESVSNSYRIQRRDWKNFTFLKRSLKPENKNKIEISISFVIDKEDGSLTYVKPNRNWRGFRNEIVRVLKLCPRWKPGEQNGKKREHYTLNLFLWSKQNNFDKTYLS